MQITPEVANTLTDFVREHVALDLDSEKAYLWAEMRKVQLYMDGNQYLIPTIQGGYAVDYQPLSIGPMNLSDTSSKDFEYGRYDSVLNVIKGDGNKLLAVLGVRSPVPTANALNEENEEQRARARLASSLLLALKRLWQTDQLQYELALSAWKDGTFFLYTPLEVDGDKYGTKEEEVWEDHETELPAPASCVMCGEPGTPDTQCQVCGGQVLSSGEPEMVSVPQLMGTTKRPLGAPGIYRETMNNVTTPFYVRGVDDAPMWIRQVEEHKSGVLERYPTLAEDDAHCADMLFSNDLQGMINRQYQQSPHGGPRIGVRTNTWLCTSIWLRPSMFNLFGKRETAREDNSRIRWRELLKAEYPEGIRIEFVGGRLVDVIGEDLRDVWACGKPGVSDYIWCPPIAKEFLSFQDCLNEVHNLFVESIERSIPFTVFNPELFSAEALASRPGTPYEMIPAVPGVGNRLSEGFYSVRGAEIEPQIQQWSQGQLEIGREITGVQAPIFGGDAGGQTATEAEMRRNQALQQLGLIWAGMNNCWTRAYRNGLKGIVKNGVEVLAKFGLESVTSEELADLLDHDGKLNGFEIVIDEGLPVTWGALRDAVMKLMSMGPDVWNLAGLGKPSNAERVQKAIGLSNWSAPGNNAYNYVMEVIRELLLSPPMVDPMSGGFQPTVPFDDFVLDPLEALMIIKEWAMSDEGRRHKRTSAKTGQPGGYENVLAWGMQAKALMEMQALQAGMQGGAEEAPGAPGAPALPPAGGDGPEPPPDVEVPPFQVQ